MSVADVNAYLTYLANTCRGWASTQKQAFNALAFLYRNNPKKGFGEHKDFPPERNRNISLSLGCLNNMKWLDAE